MFDINPLSDALLRGIVFSGAALIWVIVLVRLIGARTLSKMTAFDFVVTLATGSLLATAASAQTLPAFAQAITAMSALLVAQLALSSGRRRFPWFRRGIENEPIILLRDGKFLESALRISRVSRSDVYAKLRQADVPVTNATAVILETTGDISILTNDCFETVITDEIRST